MGMKKWLTGAGVAVTGLAAAGAMSHALTRQLVSIAVDRDCSRTLMERARKKFAGTGCNEAFMAHLERMAEKLRNLPTEKVTISARDGTPLVGHWRACPDAKRIVIALHGWRSTWDHSFGMVADFLYDNRCSVLYAEQRGQGSSGGEYMGLGLLERYDCQRWTLWAAERSALPIYLVGVSMGATAALMASALPLAAQVRGIIADCGFTSPEDIGKHVLRSNLHLSYTLRAGAADALCRRKNQVGIRGYSAVDAMKKCDLPVLFVHGADDTFVPVTMTYENYKACAGPKELLIVPGADHGMCYYVDKDRYETAVKAFWEKYDK